VSVPDFSAQESGLGYLYQARYALWLLLDGPEEQEVVLETLDDIVLSQDGTPHDLLQTKHNSVPARLTDASSPLWKTLRIWSTHIKDSVIQVPPTALTLITTAEAPANSIAAALRPGSERDCAAALDGLRKVAQTSKNDDLKAAFAAFTDLTDDEQFRLVDAIHVLDNSPDISDTGDKIRDRIRAAVDRQNRDALFERLEGWWFGKVVDQLRADLPTPVAGFEVYDKVRAIAEQFGPNALPIDYLDARPDSVDPQTDNRIFVRQLRAIDVGLTRIEKAILDYYRAYEQRSRWAREELLVGDEVESYERRLIDEWERFAAALTEELDGGATEIELKKVGRQLFNWMEQTADLRIRPNVSELYVMRGSFHILANKPTPGVWWHPKFVERLSEILAEPSVVS
jgi:C-terminal domain 7 of the ABC-three component (ABC-3C) systems